MPRKQEKGSAIKKIFLFSLGLFFVGGYLFFLWHVKGVFADSATPSAGAKELPWYERGTIDVISGLVYVIVSLMGKLIGMFVGFWFTIMQYNNFVNSDFVTIGWTIIRDICNLGFILVLLAISLGSILHIERYSYRVYLPKLLLMAILINFSRLIAGVIIDAGQIFTLTFGSHIIKIGAGNIMNSLGITVLLNMSPTAPTKITAAAILGSIILAAIFSIIAFIVIALITLTLVVRIVMLWILVVFSPIAYLFSASPVGKNYASQWWSEFIKWVFYAPILLFLVWLSLSIISTSIKKVIFNTGVPSVSLAQIGSAPVMASFVLGIILLMASLVVAQRIGGIVGNMASSAYSGIVAQAHKPINWAQRKAQGAARFSWQATKYAGKGLAVWGDSKIAAKSKSGISPLGFVGAMRRLPKAIDKAWNEKTRASYRKGDEHAHEIISGEKEANLPTTLFAKLSQTDVLAKGMISPIKGQLFLSSKKRIEQAERLKSELNNVKNEEQDLQKQEKFVQKVENSGYEEELKSFLKKPSRDKQQEIAGLENKTKSIEEELKGSKEIIKESPKNIKILQQEIKTLQKKLKTSPLEEAKELYQKELKEKQEELKKEKTKFAKAEQTAKEKEPLLEKEQRKLSLFQEAQERGYTDLDSLKKSLAARKKGITQRQQELSQELLKYAPKEIQELRIVRAKKVREKLQELEDVDDANALIPILDDALKRRDKAAVEAVLRKTFNNGDYADVLKHYKYQTDYKGLQDFMDDLAKKDSNIYGGFNQQQARKMGAGLSNMLRNQGQFSAYGAFANKNGMWERTNLKQHISSVLDRRNGYSLQKNLRDTGLSGYGYYTPEGEYKLSPAGLAYLKSIDNDRGRELIEKDLNQQVAAELNRHLEEIKEHVSEEMAKAVEKRVSGKNPDEITTEAISREFAKLEKNLSGTISDRFEEQEKNQGKKRREEAAEKEEKERLKPSNNNSSQIS